MLATRSTSGLFTSSSSSSNVRAAAVVRSRRATVAVRAHKVTVTHDGKAVTLDVPDGKTILEVALDQGIDLPHDCKLGVCMTCPAKLKAGKLEQPGSMLSEDVEAAGFALLCVAQPRSDCELVTCSEEELLDVQLCA